VPWKFVGKLFFNKGLKGGLILLGQGEKQDFFHKTCSDFLQTFFGQKKCNPKISCHNSEPSKQRMGSE
jgi:hypothetical protein